MGIEVREISRKSKSISTLEGLSLSSSAVPSGRSINEIFPPGVHPLKGDVILFRVPSPAADSEMLRIALDRNLEYLRRIEALEVQFAKMRTALGWDQPESRDVPNAQAKREIRAYFRENDGKEIYPDEIAEALNLDLMQVISLCDELEDAGKIISKA